MIPESLRVGLVAEYLLHGSAHDTSGKARDGVASGTSHGPNRSAAPDGACYFNGAGDHITVSPPPSLPGPAMSVSLWVMFSERHATQGIGTSNDGGDDWRDCIIAQDDGNDDDQSNRIFQLSCHRGRLVWHLMMYARDPIYRFKLRAGEGYHVVATVADGMHSLYVDGVFRDAEKCVLRSASPEPLHLGRKGTDEPHFFFKGAIESVRLYDRALTAAEVVTLFAEDGYRKPERRVTRRAPSAASGEWKHGITTLLDLQCNEQGVVSGRVMDGRPGRWANVDEGSFDAETGALELRGMSRAHDDSALLPYHLVGLLDDDEFTVTYRVADWSGNEVLRRDFSGGQSP